MGVFEKLKTAWAEQNSLVCVGLDPDMGKLPAHLQHSDRPYFEFGRQIIDAVAPHVCAIKPQFAHFAAAGREQELGELFAYMRDVHPNLVTILDAKRGDVGSTAEFYAREAFERYGADAVTLNPYLGFESVAPYLEYADKGLIVLCRTSNPDSDWLQNNPQDTTPVFERVARRVCEWNGKGQCMLVAGATYPEELGRIRELVGDMPLLVPGIGAQGGDLAAVLHHGADRNGTGLLISSSRGIIYAGNGEDFARAAGRAASDLQEEINSLLTQ